MNEILAEKIYAEHPAEAKNYNIYRLFSLITLIPGTYGATLKGTTALP